MVGTTTRSSDVGADNIRINLNGHRVFGTEEANGAVGIRLTGRSGVTITGPAGRGQTRGGAISGFDAGVAIIGGADNVVENLVVEDNVGFDIYGDGIATFFSSYNVIRNTLVTRNGWYDGMHLGHRLAGQPRARQHGHGQHRPR